MEQNSAELALAAAKVAETMKEAREIGKALALVGGLDTVDKFMAATAPVMEVLQAHTRGPAAAMAITLALASFFFEEYAKDAMLTAFPQPKRNEPGYL